MKDIHYEIQVALQKLEELDTHINNALELSTPGSFLHDTLLIAQRNAGGIDMKLLVASDITESA